MEMIRQPGKRAGGKRKRIGQKVGNAVVIMLAISIIVVVAVCVFMFRSLITGMLEQRCTNGTNMLAYALENGGADDVNQLLDDLKTRMGCEFSVYEGDTRAYSTVMENGKRLVDRKSVV